MDYIQCNYLSIYMPRCIKRENDGTYVVLNREFKPIGFKTSEFITYEEYPVCVKFKKMDPRTAKKLSVHEEYDPDCIYLYSEMRDLLDNEENMKKYLEKLAILSKWKVTRPM
jgi:hypothetical protein